MVGRYYSSELAEQYREERNRTSRSEMRSERRAKLVADLKRVREAMDRVRVTDFASEAGMDDAKTLLDAVIADAERQGRTG